MAKSMAKSMARGGALLALLVLIGCGLSGCASAPKRQLDLERISARWDELAKPEARRAAPLAASEVDRVLSQWRTTPGTAEERSHWSALAELRVALFATEAELRELQERADLQKLARQEILLKASQQEAEMARLEAEKLRLQNMLREEENERMRAFAEAESADRLLALQEAELARQEADGARRLAEAQTREANLARREAELLGAEAIDLRAQLAGLRPESDPRGRKLVLGDVFFTTGQGELKSDVKTAMQPVLEFIARYPGQRVLIEGHTDDRGSDVSNQTLSERRAESVRAALLTAGLPATRALEVKGLGESKPVMNNDTNSGRARNRRVEVIVEGAK